MRSATATPSSSALCASIGPRTTSPIAQTFGRLVLQSSSTTTAPGEPPPVVGEAVARRQPGPRPGAAVGARPRDHGPGHRRVLGRARHPDLVAALSRLHGAAAGVEERHLVLLEEVQDAVVVLL